MPNLKWFAVHTYSGHEQKAKRHLEAAITQNGLEEMITDILIPTEEVTEMKQGKRSTSTKKFLPSYIIVHMEMNKQTEHIVRNTPGITSFVGTAGKPVPIPQEQVDRVMGQMDRGRVEEVTDFPFRTGDPVKVIDGPFSDFSGFVSEINMERKKVKVMVSIFGRPTPVELDFLQVESV